MKREALERAIGYDFRNSDLLKQALTHRSHGALHNERLEFLGDAILNCAIAITLFDRFRGLREGELSRLRANLVRQETLYQLADAIALGDHLLLGEGELKSGGFRRPSILADALEAVFGAVFLDSGFGSAQAVIGRFYAPLLAELDPSKAGKDPKTALQEWLQSRRHPLPQYNLRATRGEAHAQEFEVECRVDDLGLVTVGSGASRRAAEQEAARRAIEQLDAK
jgi:ribonuclease III